MPNLCEIHKNTATASGNTAAVLFADFDQMPESSSGAE